MNISQTFYAYFIFLFSVNDHENLIDTMINIYTETLKDVGEGEGDDVDNIKIKLNLLKR